MRYIFFLTMFFLFILSGPVGQASDADTEAAKDIGALHAFSRETTIAATTCEKTWQINYDTQAECKVASWAADASEISIEPLAIIGIWQYVDGDFQATVTINREPQGYSIRLNINQSKYKDRLGFKIARKYIDSAITKRNLQKFTTMVARAATQIKTGSDFVETYKGALQVVSREVLLARGQLFFQKCQQAWSGFTCGMNLIRNTRGESLLSDIQKMVIASGSLTLAVKGYRAWQDGTAYSGVSILLKANRFQRDLNLLAGDYDNLVRQLAKLNIISTQIAGDNHPSPVYSQRVLGDLRAVAQELSLSLDGCKATYQYLARQFKGRCEVKTTWPGLLAQPASVYSQFLNFKNVQSLVQIVLTTTGWRAEFTGDEKSVGKFGDIEPHLSEAIKTLSANNRLFLLY